MENLTKRQKEILAYITKFIKKNDYAPSLEEIKEHFKLSSVSTVHQHVEAIKEKGYLEKIENQPRSIELNSKRKRLSELVEIPLLGTIAAGQPIEAIEEKEKIEVPKNLVSKSGENFALKVQGDSMIGDGVFDGDIVIIKKQETADNGETVVALLNGDEVTLKKIYKEKNGFRLQPANPNLKPIFTKELQVQGKVVSVIRKLEDLKEVNLKPEIQKKSVKENKIKKLIKNKKSNLKMIWGDAKIVLKNIDDESIDLMITSPPYFNAREYSTWKDLDSYLKDMKEIFKECYRTLGNHRVFVLNVGDVNCQLGKQPWTKRRVPLGALFTVMFQELGFEYVDDFIWDKGEPQSYRHKNGKTPYPMYQYPINCYEHILIFHKHKQDMTRIPCPVCGSKHVQNNSQSEIGVQSWECNNEDCLHRSPGNRGKRYSARSIMMQNGQKKKNIIEEEIIKKWRKDIVKFSPVIKFGPRGENRIGHTAPFPKDIPEFAIKYYSYVGDKVMDPFSGSFTTAIVAKKLNRIGIGIDINKELFQNSVKERIEKEFGILNLKLFKEKSSAPKYEEIDILDI